MKRVSMMAALAAVVSLLVAGVGLAQEMTPEQQAEMMKATSPGEHHGHIKVLAGSYTYVAKMWMAPGTDPVTSEGKAEKKLIMGGRYLQDTSEGDFMGRSFTGMGTMGYDNMQGHYINTWIDNFGTGIMVAHGSCSVDKTWTLKGETLSPMTQTMAPFQQVIRVVDENTHVLEWSWGMPDGSMFKGMEITYTRVKG